MYEGGELVAAAPLDRVTLEATSDNSSLERGEAATFSVRVAGLPLGPPSAAPPSTPAAGPTPIAFLDYVNNTPEIGRFRERADAFSVPILASDLTESPAPVRGWDQRALLERVEKMVFGAGPRPGTAAESPPGSDATPGSSPSADRDPAGASGVFEHQQEYRAAQLGDFHVRVAVRLPDETATLMPMVALPESPNRVGGRVSPIAPSGVAASSRLSSGVDDRGAYADVDGRRFYFSIGYQQGVSESAQTGAPARSFEVACFGACQCQIESWDHAEEVGNQVRALDRSRPGWRRLEATTRGCACPEAKSQCYSQLSFECKARCKRLFSSSLTDRVSGWAVGAEVGECRDVGACADAK
jgi:hypothetical protein